MDQNLTWIPQKGVGKSQEVEVRIKSNVVVGTDKQVSCAYPARTLRTLTEVINIEKSSIAYGAHWNQTTEVLLIEPIPLIHESVHACERLPYLAVRVLILSTLDTSLSAEYMY